jgi:hypothetical protein
MKLKEPLFALLSSTSLSVLADEFIDKQLIVNLTQEINNKLSLGIEYDMVLGNNPIDYYGLFVRKYF